MKSTSTKSLRLALLSGRFAVCKLDAAAKVDLPESPGFFSITRTSDEVSLVCDESLVPDGAEVEGGWRTLKLEGPFEFSLTGVISSVTSPLADAGIPVFVLSTFDTDYLLIKDEDLADAVSVLGTSGHEVEAGGDISGARV